MEDYQERAMMQFNSDRSEITLLSEIETLGGARYRKYVHPRFVHLFVIMVQEPGSGLRHRMPKDVSLEFAEEFFQEPVSVDRRDSVIRSLRAYWKVHGK